MQMQFKLLASADKVSAQVLLETPISSCYIYVYMMEQHFHEYFMAAVLLPNSIGYNQDLQDCGITNSLTQNLSS